MIFTEYSIIYVKNLLKKNKFRKNNLILQKKKKTRFLFYPFWVSCVYLECIPSVRHNINDTDCVYITVGIKYNV